MPDKVPSVQVQYVSEIYAEAVGVKGLQLAILLRLHHHKDATMTKIFNTLNVK